MAIFRGTLLMLFAGGAALAAELCPIYGPVFPTVTHLSASSTWRQASVHIKTALDDAFASGNTSHGPVAPKDTYSIQIFSAREKLFEYYNKGASLTSSGQHGNQVNGDSVYRIGSTSKLYAVYLLLIVAGDKVFSEMVTSYFPELKGVGYWDEVTVGALAGQVGGVVSDLYDTDPITTGGLGAHFPGAFPPLSKNETSPCVLNVTHCTRAEFLHALKGRRFTYLPNSTPGYSNSAFVLIGYIIETITNTPFASALSAHLLQPLGLHHTYASAPKDEGLGVIIYNTTVSGWNIDLSEATAEGGIFASASDVSAIGRSILSSTLLPANTTRGWFKPTAFTSSPIGFVGRPWEIFRAIQSPVPNRVVDIYTKGGNIDMYTSILALIPDLGVGFTILVASEEGNQPRTVAGVIADALIPAVEEAERLEAHTAYAGTYRATHINSSITLSTAAGKPGLTLSKWISNGTDVFPVFMSPKDFRVYPSNTGEQNSGAKYLGSGGKKVSWKAISGLDFGYEDHGAFSACPTWLDLDRPTWGLFGLDDWVFEIGRDGKATSVEIATLKVVLEREK